MQIRTRLLSTNDLEMTDMSIKSGYKKMWHVATNEHYLISVDDLSQDEPEWPSISLDPLCYPWESVSMTYE